MMEDIVLLETEIADPKRQVFQLQFDVGEFDKVIANEENLTCEVYEIDENNFYVQYRKIYLRMSGVFYCTGDYW